MKSRPPEAAGAPLPYLHALADDPPDAANLHLPSLFPLSVKASTSPSPRLSPSRKQSHGHSLVGHLIRRSAVPLAGISSAALSLAMDPQWQQGYADSGAPSRRYNNAAQIPRDYSSQMPPQNSAQPPAGFKYDQHYQGPAASSAASPNSTPQMRDGNGDVPMHDAQDPYASMKYPMRPHHQTQLSSSRPPHLHSSQEPSAAAQRYSPMEALSPTSPYPPKSAAQNQYTSPPQRQSPTRQDYTPSSSYFPNRQQAPQLPPISPYSSGHETFPQPNIDGSFSDPKHPSRRHVVLPVPEFRKLRGPNDLHPKVNAQPAFRRANPEGGFISVSPSPCSLWAIPRADLTCSSLFNLLPSICPQPTEYVTRTSNTNPLEIRAAF